MKKSDFTDITFLIPVLIDSKDRARNLFLVTDFVNKHFDTNILVVEQNAQLSPSILKGYSNIEYFFVESFERIRKSRIINVGIEKIKTPFLVIQDCDIVARPFQYMFAAELLRNNSADAVLPYDHITWEIMKEDINTIYPIYDFSIIDNFHMRNITPPNYGPTIGGIVFYNRSKLIQTGMYNEKFTGWGNEDDEIYYRFRTLGYRWTRIGGDIYHLSHWRDSTQMGYGPGNQEEYRRIAQMNKEQLEKEIMTWKWVNHINT